MYSTETDDGVNRRQLMSHGGFFNGHRHRKKRVDPAVALSTTGGGGEKILNAHFHQVDN